MASTLPLRFLLVALVVFSVAVQPAYSQDDANTEGAASDDAPEYQQVPVHPLTDLPGSSPDIRATFVLPDIVNNVFAIGEVTTIVLGLQNTGSKLYNVTSIWGSLNSPFNSKMFIQNFTGRPYGRFLEGGADASFEYRFLPSPELEAMDLQLAFTVFYEDESSVYSNTFFNQTVTFEDNGAPIDIKSTFKLISIVSIISGISYILIKGTSTKKARKSRSTGAADTTAVTGEFAEEYKKRFSRSATPSRKSD